MGRVAKGGYSTHTSTSCLSVALSPTTSYRPNHSFKANLDDDGVYEAALIKGKGEMVKCDDCEEKDINTLLAEVKLRFLKEGLDSLLAHALPSRL